MKDEWEELVRKSGKRGEKWGERRGFYMFYTIYKVLNNISVLFKSDKGAYNYLSKIMIKMFIVSQGPGVSSLSTMMVVKTRE